MLLSACSSDGKGVAFGPMTDDTIIDTPAGPMTWGAWKKKNPVQVASRRTKGKDLPNKIKRRTND